MTRPPGPSIRYKRKISGMSAVLLPFLENGEIDWNGFRKLVQRTADSGLIPAVNMDTGYGPFLDEQTRVRALKTTREICGDNFVGGAFVADSPGAQFDLNSYMTQIDAVQQQGGIPIIFQSYGLAHGDDEHIISGYQEIANRSDSFLAFELGAMFADFGAIYSMEVYRELMCIQACVGAKHSSLNRELEWIRLELRDRLRPDFKVLTGNDLAIDMVIYGSDYLLGLSTFCPELFAKRDQMWEAGDLKFYELNDALQYLGAFAFRHPTTAYKHNAAMFLYQRNQIESDLTHSKCAQRPEADRAVLHEIGVRLGVDMCRERMLSQQ